MEEKKTKTVNITDAAKKEKMTYEELNNVATQLSSQNRELIRRLQDSNLTGIFKRLDYLFKVVELGNKVFEDEFIKACTVEIVNIMTVPDDTKEE